MKQNRYYNRLKRIFSVAPPLWDIFTSKLPIQEKRSRIREFLSDQLFATFDDNPKIPHLEWILATDAVSAFRKIISERSEKLSDFSFIEYLDNLIRFPDAPPDPPPSRGFLAELTHLLRGVTGQSGIYTDRMPAFLKHSGRKAAKLRSNDLSRMARYATRHMDGFPWGLDPSVVRRRKNNRNRILKFFGATDSDWKNWKWHTRHIIRNPETLADLIKLTDEELEAIQLARAYNIPFGITPYYLSLMDVSPGGGADAAVRAQVIPPLHYVKEMRAHKDSLSRSMDFMMERDTSPIANITRRYPMIVILKPVMTCPQICVYCQRNWEIEDVYSRKAFVSREEVEKAIEWIAETPEIREVLITGGDPFLLSDDRLNKILSKVAAIKHVERIRLGSRTPVTLPQRITDSLIQTIARYHRPGKREVILITHFEHQYEISPDALEAVQKFRQKGIDVYNQLVFTLYNSRKFEAAALRSKLRMIGVTPYYTFNTKGKEETKQYRVPIARLLQEQQEEARLLPGTVRTDEIVFNVPRLGKNYLRAAQHHSIISILPDGRRVYEFHPWEKKLALADTYVYTDVSIYDYLQRLSRLGENTSHYKSIWYYY